MDLCLTVTAEKRQETAAESESTDFRKLWNAEDDGFTTREGADIMRHGQGAEMLSEWRSLPFCGGKAGEGG